MNERQYMTDAQGREVPTELVKDIDKLRDQTVRGLFSRFKEKAAELTDFRQAINEEIGEFLSLSAEQYGVKMGGAKGGVTLTSYDGSIKIEISNNDVIAFTEQLQVARELILKCVQKWSDGSRSELRALIDNAFKVDKQGMVSTSRILGLRSIDIHDADWQTAMKAITDSIQVVSSRKYLRVSVRDADGKYQLQQLDARAL